MIQSAEYTNPGRHYVSMDTSYTPPDRRAVVLQVSDKGVKVTPLTDDYQLVRIVPRTPRLEDVDTR